MLRVLAIAIVLSAFGVLTHLAGAEHGGFVGLWKHGFKDIGSTQILVDLMLTSCFALAWMWRDARERQATMWPFVAACIIGASGFLAYLLVREATVWWRGPVSDAEGSSDPL